MIKEGRITSKVMWLILITSYLFSVGLCFVNYNNLDFVYFLKPDLTNNISLVLFIFLTFLALRSLKVFTFLLVLMVLSFPSSVDNYLPSILISAASDYRKVYFPIVTHVDIFLLLGILKFKVLNKKYSDEYSSYLIIVVCILLFLSSLINSTRATSITDVTLITAGSYHLRYIILLFLLFKTTNIIQYSRQLYYGLFFALIVLIIEVFVYTFFINSHFRLISGSLRVNSLGNILSALSCYFLFLILRKKISNLYFFLVISLLFLLYLNGTRSAIFILVGYFIFEIINFLFIKAKKWDKKFILLSVSLIFFSLLVYSVTKTQRFNITNFRIEKIDLTKRVLKEIIVFEQNEFTASLVLRLDHYQTSLNMIKESPIWGIGTGKWNKYKQNYGSNDRNLMDSHNDLLAFSSQYGILTGCLVCFSLYFIPYFAFRKSKKNNRKKSNPLSYLYVINLFMAFAGLTNAGLFKHQVYGFLVLILMMNLLANQYEIKNIE